MLATITAIWCCTMGQRWYERASTIKTYMGHVFLCQREVRRVAINSASAELKLLRSDTVAAAFMNVSETYWTH